MAIITVNTRELGDLEDMQRGRKALPETIKLFQEAVNAMDTPGIYIGLDTVYHDKQEAYDSVAAVIEYGKRRGYKIHLRLMGVYEDEHLKGYRCVIRAGWMES